MNEIRAKVLKLANELSETEATNSEDVQSFIASKVYWMKKRGYVLSPEENQNYHNCFYDGRTSKPWYAMLKTLEFIKQKEQDTANETVN